nr:hypothetical protein CFP56_64155 [Quercus suber]
MHELPRDLDKSLRSWRGSVYGHAGDEAGDVEKGLMAADHEEDEKENPTKSSLVLHPTASRQALHDAYMQHQSQSQQQQQQRHEQQQQQQHRPQSSSRDFHSDPRRPSHRPAPILTSPSALAKRQTTAVSTVPETATTTKKSIFSGPKIDDPDPAADRLDDSEQPLPPADFYELMGMRPPISKYQNPRDLAIKHGFYARIHQKLEYTQTKYRVYDILIYIFLVIQLFLAATFIILGSLARVDAHLAIAILGGASTVIAGALALMKGQGLPNRLRQTRDALRNVVFEAHELYWDVGADRPVFYRDVRKVREDYLRVLEQARRNHPDTWNETTLGIAQSVRHTSAATTANAPSRPANTTSKTQEWSVVAPPALAGVGPADSTGAGAAAGRPAK